jgi:hypothetical protein
LLEVGARPGMTLQVLPFESGAHAGMRGPFSILEFPDRTDSRIAHVESMGGFIYMEKDREVRTCSDALDRLRAAALAPGASADLIATVRANL